MPVSVKSCTGSLHERCCRRGRQRTCRHLSSDGTFFPVMWSCSSMTAKGTFADCVATVCTARTSMAATRSGACAGRRVAAAGGGWRLQEERGLRGNRVRAAQAITEATSCNLRLDLWRACSSPQ